MDETASVTAEQLKVLQEAAKIMEANTQINEDLDSEYLHTNGVEHDHQGENGELEDVPDFAPRQTPEDALLAHVESMQSTLAALWGEVEDVKTRLDSGDELGERWGSIREKLGLVIREWERGKGAAAHLSGAGLEAASLVNQDARRPIDVEPVGLRNGGDDYGGKLPDFMSSWTSETDPGEDASSSAEPDVGPNQTVLAEYDVEGLLPPPGMDEIFESDLSLAPFRQASNLSREERIKLVKEARANGNLRPTSHGDENDAAAETREARMNGGDVVEELKGMIGLIRRKKGMGDVPEPRSNGEHEQPVAVGGPMIASCKQASPESKDQGDPMLVHVSDHPSLNEEERQTNGSPTHEKAAEEVPEPPRNSNVRRQPSLSNVLFPSEDMRKAFVFPALDTRHVE